MVTQCENWRQSTSISRGHNLKLGRELVKNCSPRCTFLTNRVVNYWNILPEGELKANHMPKIVFSVEKWSSAGDFRSFGRKTADGYCTSRRALCWQREVNRRFPKDFKYWWSRKPFQDLKQFNIFVERIKSPRL